MISTLFCSLSFTICALIFNIIAFFILVYRSGSEVKKSSTYYYLILMTFVVILLEFLMTFTVKLRDLYPLLNTIICKSYAFSVMTWPLVLTYHMKSYDKNFKINWYPVFFSIVCIISLILTIFLPLEYSNPDIYTFTGPLAYSIHIMCVLMIIIELTILLFDIIKIKNLLKLPLYIGSILYGLLIVYQFFIGNFLNILSFMDTLIVIVLFFTAESQDDKLLIEYEEQKELSEQVNKEKDKFLSSMSKEIRTPMSNIMGLSDLIMINKDSITLESIKSNGKEIHNESMYLLDTINDILDLARYEAGKEELVNTDYSFEKFILELDDYVTKKGLKASYSFAPNLPENLNGDVSKLKKIIQLKIEEESRNYIISKIDFKFSYEGIIEGYLYGLIDVSFIFDGTLDNDLSEGLNLEQSIIDCCCEITKMSVTMEQVSDFKRIFSVKYYNKINDDKELSNMNEKIEKRHNISNSDEAVDYSDKRIIVVDDSQININIVKRLFKKYNFTLDEAISGEKCIELCKTNKYDLILLDDMMPGLSGVETLTELKKLGINSPTIALTANSYDGLKEKYMADGFSDYLSKPIDSNKMDDILREYLNKGGEDNAL